MINPSMLTARLKLVPHAPAALLAIQKRAEAYAQSFGYTPAEGLHEMYISSEVSPEWRAQLLAATAPDPWQHGFALVHVASNLVIGAGGFVGPPDADGVVPNASLIDFTGTPFRRTDASAGQYWKGLPYLKRERDLRRPFQ